jgi:hypothetical protein
MSKTRLISLAVIAALMASGTATAMAAASDHPKKRTHSTQASNKQAPKSKARTGSAPVQQPSGGHDSGYN